MSAARWLPQQLSPSVPQLHRREQLQPFLKLIPEINFNKEKVENIYNVAEDRDNFDYIFSSEELSKLIGQKYHTHRNFINRFNKHYPDATTKIISLENPATQKQIVDIFNKWAGGKKVSKEETKHELTAIKKTLENAGSFKLLCTGVYDGERMIAYMIADIDHPEYCDTHFAKADPKYQGIFYVLYNNFAKELLSLGYKYMNNEQDLGLEGLRYSKSQWNPVNFFKKYIIVSNL